MVVFFSSETFDAVYALWNWYDMGSFGVKVLMWKKMYNLYNLYLG